MSGRCELGVPNAIIRLFSRLPPIALVSKPAPSCNLLSNACGDTDMTLVRNETLQLRQKPGNLPTW
jgi:hypothetical protein